MLTFSELTGAEWRKSSHSGAGNDCVELVVARMRTSVRDSKRPDVGHIEFASAGWNVFLGALKDGRLDA